MKNQVVGCGYRHGLTGCKKQRFLPSPTQSRTRCRTKGFRITARSPSGKRHPRATQPARFDIALPGL